MTACTAIEVRIPADTSRQEAAVAALVNDLATLPEVGYSEIWVYRGCFPALCALLNGGQGWLMFVRYDGDAGFSSRNPEYTGPPDAEVEYRLGNGQVDSYPAAWAYPRAKVLKALHSFGRTGRVDGISWFNDSGDGTLAPFQSASQSD